MDNLTFKTFSQVLVVVVLNYYMNKMTLHDTKMPDFYKLFPWHSSTSPQINHHRMTQHN